MHLARSLTALVSALILTAALDGCSIRVVDGAGASGSPTPTATYAMDVEVSPHSAAPKPVPATDPPATDAGITRAELIARATTVQRCDGELTLTQDAMAIRVEGACDRLIVNASAAQIVTDDVTDLEVIGDGNIVLAGAVRQLTVNGSANVVKWTGATPTVTDVGSANTLTAG